MSIDLLEHFSALNDPRQAWKLLYPMPEILLTVLCATMAGADDFVEISLWGRNKIDFLRRFLIGRPDRADGAKRLVFEAEQAPRRAKIAFFA